MNVILTAQQIEQRLDELAAQIAHDYSGQDLVCIGVLKGCFVLLADLIRRMDIPLEVDFVAASSYGAGHEAGQLHLLKDVSLDIRGRQVLLVEDICDTGQSLTIIKRLLAGREPLSIKTFVLLDKPARRQVPFTPDYVGFAIPDLFVVGYGLDYGEKYRNLPYVAAIEPSVNQDQKDNKEAIARA